MAFVCAKSHLGLLALACTALSCLVYLAAGNGAWMFALTDHGGIGFAPDPAYWMDNVGVPANYAFACAGLAGTVLLPFAALAMCGRFDGIAHATGTQTASRARGISPWRLGLNDFTCVSIPTLALFTFATLGQTAVCCLQAGCLELMPSVLALVVPRLAIILVAGASLIACSLAVFRIVPNRPAAFGIMAVGFIAACVAQLSFPESVQLTHASFLMHACSMTDLSAIAVPAVTFSAITSAVALALYAARG
ncbi:MAG: hypothetical protein Q4B77_07120 [Coriobacteriaceae bacterium]|nr:hypothetical protein [Coriobacteriaceae bacterium]